MEETSIDSWLYKPEADFLVEMQACARELNNGMKTLVIFLYGYFKYVWQWFWEVFLAFLMLEK